MRRVVVTGLGIISSIGNDQNSVLDSLKKGKSGIKTRDEDSVIQTLSVNTHTSVLFFSNEGLAYKVKAWKIPEGSTTSRGKSLFKFNFFAHANKCCLANYYVFICTHVITLPFLLSPIFVLYFIL